jgi:hypothetical protein
LDKQERETGLGGRTQRYALYCLLSGKIDALDTPLDSFPSGDLRPHQTVLGMGVWANGVFSLDLFSHRPYVPFHINCKVTSHHCSYWLCFSF